MDDQMGLQSAYNDANGLYQRGDTLYIAGTRNLGHVAEWWKIPAGHVKDSDIYGKTNSYLSQHPEVKNLVGHSYGGSVALEFQKGNNSYSTRTYGAPVFDPIPRNPLHKPERYCNKFDPVCAADFGASKRDYINPFNPNPHSYFNTPKPNTTTRHSKTYSTQSRSNGFVMGQPSTSIKQYNSFTNPNPQNNFATPKTTVMGQPYMGKKRYNSFISKVT
jgi:hypothetical protein